MTTFHAIFLALVQGLTEFLPISSSAHLILVPWFLGWTDQGLAFDVMVHLGTLTAVCGYFRHDLAAMAGAGITAVKNPRAPWPADARMLWFIGLATIPVGLVGLAAKDWIETVARNPVLIGVTSIVFGLLLWGADRLGKKRRTDSEIGLRDALLIGVSQAVALIPGVSRSGVTMTAGMALGLTREGAARFSFLLSIPVIVLSGGLQLIDLIQTGISPGMAMPMAVGFVTAAISAYLCIKYLMIYLQRHSMGVFVLYRVILGVVILAIAL